MSALAVDIRTHNAGLRTRTVDELRADLTAGCESLGNLSAEWRANGLIRDHDIATVDRTCAGLQRLLVDLRVARGGFDGS